jgi:predicted TIM-barrel fold metal-dependent hydrolase
MTLQSAVGAGNDRLFVVDAHTHTSGPEHDGPAEDVVACLDACGVEKAFVFAPLLAQQGLHLTEENLKDIRVHNDYVADFCSRFPDRLLGFAVLNPNPRLTGGDLERAGQLMAEEARRCYEELGLRGVKMVPDRWTADREELVPLWRQLAELGMHVVFHAGIFMDERASSYCRPTFFEGVHQAEGFHGQLAHLGWPWVEETIGTLAMESEHPEDGSEDPWQLIADFSFGAPPDWQLETVRKALDTVEPQRLVYGSDCFWPQTPEQYLEQYLLPHLATFEAAAAVSRNGSSAGSPQRTALRRQVFHDNALRHWRKATREVQQQPRRAAGPLQAANSRRGCC